MSIKKHFIGLLQKYGLWSVPEVKGNPLKDRALELIIAVDSFQDTSGEYKRHKVYAQLIKEFPAVTHRDLGFLIELILQENKDV